MEAGSVLLWLACAAGAGGVGVLRYAWALPRRSSAANTAGWLLLLASVIFGWSQGGAWGVAVAALVTTAAAFVALTVAGVTSPAGRAAPRKRADRAVRADENRAIGRRIATFMLVIPGGFVASIAVGVAMRGAGTLLGWGEANANVAAIFSVPLSWAVLVVVLLMQVKRRSQALTLLGCALAGTPFLVTALAS